MQQQIRSKSSISSSFSSASATGASNNIPQMASGGSNSVSGSDAHSAASLQGALLQDPHFSEAVRDVLAIFTSEELSSEPFLKQYVTEELARWGRWTQRGRAAAVCFEAACVGALRSLQKRGLSPTELTARADQTLARCLAGMVIDAVEPLAMEHGGAVREKAIGIVADEFLARAASPRIANSAKRRVKKRQSGFRNSGQGFPSDGETSASHNETSSSSNKQPAMTANNGQYSSSSAQSSSPRARPMRSPDRRPVNNGLSMPIGSNSPPRMIPPTPTRKTSASSSPFVSPSSSPRMGASVIGGAVNPGVNYFGSGGHSGPSIVPTVPGSLSAAGLERKKSIPGREAASPVQMFTSSFGVGTSVSSVGGAGGGGAEARARARARRAHEQQKEQNQQQYMVNPQNVQYASPTGPMRPGSNASSTGSSNNNIGRIPQNAANPGQYGNYPHAGYQMPQYGVYPPVNQPYMGTSSSTTSSAIGPTGSGSSGGGSSAASPGPTVRRIHPPHIIPASSQTASTIAQTSGTSPVGNIPSSSRFRQNSVDEYGRVMYQSGASTVSSSSSTGLAPGPQNWSSTGNMSSSEYWRQRSSSTTSATSSNGGMSSTSNPDYDPRIHVRRGSQEHLYQYMQRRPSEDAHRNAYANSGNSGGEDPRLNYRRPSDPDSASSNYRRGGVPGPGNNGSSMVADEHPYNASSTGISSQYSNPGPVSPSVYRRPSADNGINPNNGIYASVAHRRPSLDDTARMYPARFAGQAVSGGDGSSIMASGNPNMIPQSSSTPQFQGPINPNNSIVSGPGSSTGLGPYITSRKTSLDGPPSSVRKTSEDKNKGGLSDLLQSIMDECEDYQEDLHRN